MTTEHKSRERKGVLNRLLKGLSCLALLLIIYPQPVTAKEEVRIGILSIWGEKVTRQMWQPTIDHFNRSIPDHHFKMVMLKLSETKQAVANKQIDFISTNPGNYVELEMQYGASRLVTIRKLRQGIPSPQFGSVIFTRSDNKSINSLYDLRGKSFMAVTETAFGGFQMAWYELKKAGIDPFKDFTDLSFSGFPQDKVVYAVRENKVTAGTVRTDTLERMAQHGLIKLTDFKIINQQQNPGFPFAHSTQLYPEWPFVKLAHSREELARRVTVALLSIYPRSEAAMAAGSSGWTVPLDYQPVRNLMRELNIGPFKHYQKTDVWTYLLQYWWLLLLLLLLISPPIIAYIKRLQERVQESLALARTESEWNHALDFLVEPFCMVGLDDRLIRANKAYYKVIGVSAAEATGRKLNTFIHPDNLDEEHCKLCQARKKREDTIITLEADDPSNVTGHPVEISINVIHNSRGIPMAIIQGMRDLTHIRQAETALRQNEARLRDLIGATPDPLLIIDHDGVITLINKEFHKSFGYSDEDLIGHKVEKLIPSEIHDQHIGLRSNYMQAPKSRPKSEVLDLVCLHEDGRHIPVEISLSPFQDEDNTSIAVSLRDITARLEAEKELKRLASFPEESPIPIIEMKKDENITYVNPVANELFPELASKGKEHVLLQGISDLIRQLESNDQEVMRDIEIDGAIYEQKISYDAEEQLLRIYFWDITKIRDMTRQMAYQASHDSLTKLINRREFEVRIEQALSSVEFENKQHVLCYMDLDQFKIVNDTCGHIAGDELLKQLSTILQAQLRESDTLARLGGDEFGLLLTGCPVDTAEEIANKLRTTVESFRFSWDDKIFKVGMSIGLVPITRKELSTTDVMSAADTACYIAKEHGRNRTHVYNPDDSLSAKHTSEMNWISRIHTALEEDRFVLYCQQILNLADTSKSYYEILIRMKSEDGELIPPLAFLPAAERYNLISAIDKWVLTNAIKIFSRPELAEVDFAINLSGHTISDPKFTNTIIDEIHNSGIDPARITLEVTETAMVANLGSAIRLISTLKGLGCRFALDDFGSGFSSFAYLKNLPVDLIKIDGGFVRDMTTDPINAVMVESMIHIGHQLELETVAEFVENEETQLKLKGMGVDYVQGYGIALPMPVEELSKSFNQLKRKA